jgi:parallel beta-helix repeat protein
MKRGIVLSLVVGFIFICFLGLGSGLTNITDCGGSLSNDQYVLTRSINTTSSICLDISGNNVFIDGAGYSITKQGSMSGSGIFADPGSNLDNITIKNFANISGFNMGINIAYSTQVNITNITLTSNATISSTSVRCIFFTDVDYSTISNVNCVKAYDGVRLESDSNNNILSNINVFNVTGASIRLNGASNNSFQNGFLTGGTTGISFLGGGGQNNIFRNITISNFSYSGIWLTGQASSNNLFYNINSSNNRDGVFVDGSNGSRFYNSTLFSNKYGVECRITNINRISIF